MSSLAPPSNLRITNAIQFDPSYFGVTWHNYPGDTVISPVMNYGSVRTMEYGPDSGTRTRWLSMEPTSGIYNWGTGNSIDTLVNTHFAAGRKVLFTLGYGIPGWCATYPLLPSSWGGPGGADSWPNDYQAWRNFVTAVVTRYRGKLDAVEVWNEPRSSVWVALLTNGIGAGDTALQVSFPTLHSPIAGIGNVQWIPAGGGTCGNITSPLLFIIEQELVLVTSLGCYGTGQWVVQRGMYGSQAVAHAIGTKVVQAGGYWLTNDAKLVSMMKHAYQATKAIDPAIKVVSPPFVGDKTIAESAYSLLNTEAEDGGGIGADFCDVIGCHLYSGIGIDSAHNVTFSQGAFDLYQSMQNLSGMVAKPWWNTEFGNINISAMTPAQRAEYFAKIMIVPALFGCSRSIFYAGDDSNCGVLSPRQTGSTWNAIPDWNAMVQKFTGSPVVSFSINNSVVTILQANGTYTTL